MDCSHAAMIAAASGFASGVLVSMLVILLSLSRSTQGSSPTSKMSSTDDTYWGGDLPLPPKTRFDVDD